MHIPLTETGAFSSALRRLGKKAFLTLGLTLASVASQSLNAQHTPAGTTTQILGVGAGALLGGDLTDPENNGVDAAGMALDPAGNWNFVTIDASHEPDFEGAESSFNIFDNKVGGGNDKWCCDDPIVDTPVYVTVEFTNAVAITHFTVTSGNDTPARDPVDWAIQGSNDGATFNDIYHFNGATAPWTERNQVVKFTLPAPATPYKFIRYIAYNTPDPLHQINEIEYFGLSSGGQFTIAAPSATYSSLTFVANNTTTSMLDTNSVRLTVDGQVVSTTVTTNGPTSTIRYLPTTFFSRDSTHTYSIVARDVQGNALTNTGSFSVPIGFFPIANLPSGTATSNWFVRTVFETGAAVDSLATAVNVLTNAGTATQVGQVIDTNSPALDFGPGGLFMQNYPYPQASVIGEAGPFDNFTQLGVFNLVITEESDYTFGVHSDDGFALRIRGARALSVNGAGQLDPFDPETVAHHGTTGDSNTRAVYHLTNGTYRVEFVWYEAGGGDYAELYWAKGAFAADTDAGANWVLLGTNIGPTPILPRSVNLPSPAVSNGVWSVRFAWNLTDASGTLLQIDSLARAVALLNATTNPASGATFVDVTAPVINWDSGGIFGANVPIPEAVTSGAGWTKEDYVMLAVGHIQVPEAGEYTFGTHSDDGAAFRVIGGELLSVSGNGRRDIGANDAVVHPGTTGDSNTRAVYRLNKGIYRVEYLYFERGGGDNGEFYVAKGAFVNDADTTNWMLVGDPTGGRDYKILGLDAAGVTVTSSAPGGDPLNTLADALADYDATSAGPSTNYPRAFIGDPETNPGVHAFPKNTPAADDDFAVKITGTIVVPTAGTYQIGFNSDDGGYVRIPGQTFLEVQPGSAAPGATIQNGNEVQCDCLTGDANSYATITLAAGTYPFEAFLFERGGGAYIAVKGAEVGAPMGLLPALATNAPATFRTQISLGPLTTQPAGADEGTRLTVSRSGNNITIAWSPTGGTLETTSALGPNASWTPVGTQNPATLPIGTAPAAFYRVRK